MLIFYPFYIYFKIFTRMCVYLFISTITLHIFIKCCALYLDAHPDTDSSRESWLYYVQTLHGALAARWGTLQRSGSLGLWLGSLSPSLRLPSPLLPHCQAMSSFPFSVPVYLPVYSLEPTNHEMRGKRVLHTVSSWQEGDWDQKNVNIHIIRRPQVTCKLSKKRFLS